jgi:hypothetical protein
MPDRMFLLKTMRRNIESIAARDTYSIGVPDSGVKGYYDCTDACASSSEHNTFRTFA